MPAFNLGPGDVHVDAPVAAVRPKKAAMAPPKTMKPLSTKKRKALPQNAFAWPEKRAYPVHDASHARNAMARLEQQKASLPRATYERIRGNILKAYRRFGIQHEESKNSAAPLRRGRLHMRFDLIPGGGHRVEVMHGSDGVDVRLPSIELDETITESLDPERVAALEVQASEAETTGDADKATALRAEAASLRASDAASHLVWIQVAKVGTFRGHPAGPFELTPAIFDEIVRNFDATENRRIPIDFEHASESEPAEGSIPTEGAPAQGWILRLENRGAAGLWGLVEWLEPARTYIRQKKYRYFSPAIRFGAKDRVTAKPIGARMTSGGLTNKPFLDGMVPLAAKDTQASSPATTTAALGDTMIHKTAPPGDMKARLRAALRMGELAEYADMKCMVARLRSMAECATEDLMAETDGQVVDLKPYCADLRACMSLPVTSTIGDILDAVEEMIEQALERHEQEYHPMSDTAENGAEIAVKLGEANAKVTTLTDANRKLEEQSAALSLKLKDAESKVALAEQRAATAEAEVKTLRDEIARRDDQAVEERVNTAFETYKDVKKLGDAEKKAMRILLKADRATFDELYPPVPPSQQHLLRNVATQRQGIPAQTQGATALMGGAAAHQGATTMRQQPVAVDAPGALGGQAMSHIEMLTLADRLQKERGISREQALNLAFVTAKGSLRTQ